MARLRRTLSVEGDDHSTATRDSSHPPTGIAGEDIYGHASQSPAPSVSSDKENQEEQPPSKPSMGPPPRPIPQMASSLHASKKRRLGEHGAPLQDQNSRSRSATEEPDNQFYDPNQDLEERRRVVKGLRDLNKDASELRTEWLQADSTGLVDAVTRANTLFQSVKQTSDATIDSRLLVTAGDLTYKKTQQASTGDGSQGVDVEEFVSKCVSFMRMGDHNDEDLPNTQRRRRQAGREVDSDEEEQATQDSGDALNWEWLGMHACFPTNSRPAVPGFLLGPLSLQKRSRTQIQRRARQQRLNPEDAVRPQELQAEDLRQQEHSNLTSICKKIHHRLGHIIQEGTQKAEEETTDDMNDMEVREVLERHNICEDGGVSLFRFAINPKSFGQTVENLFYVSFLIKEGLVGVQEEESGMPTLHYVPSVDGNQQEQEQEQRRRHHALRHQAVFSLDFEIWKELVEIFRIRQCLIPHRIEEDTENVGATGWYG